jgi:hypothetical protein
MIRLMGILTGSLIALAIMVFVIGIPELSQRPAQPFPDTAPVIASDLVAAAPLTDDPRQTAATNAVEKITAQAPVEPLAPAHESVLPAPIEPFAAAGEPAPENEDNWFAFWSPFRSELAAAGFIGELQRTTGLDYRVVKLKPGVYEVAFAYSDESDIQGKLSRISAATGLDLGGG